MIFYIKLESINFLKLRLKKWSGRGRVLSARFSHAQLQKCKENQKHYTEFHWAKQKNHGENHLHFLPKPIVSYLFEAGCFPFFWPMKNIARNSSEWSNEIPSVWAPASLIYFTVLQGEFRNFSGMNEEFPDIFQKSWSFDSFLSREKNKGKWVTRGYIKNMKLSN